MNHNLNAVWDHYCSALDLHFYLFYYHQRQKLLDFSFSVICTFFLPWNFKPCSELAMELSTSYCNYLNIYCSFHFRKIYDFLLPFNKSSLCFLYLRILHNFNLNFTFLFQRYCIYFFNFSLRSFCYPFYFKYWFLKFCFINFIFHNLNLPVFNF